MSIVKSTWTAAPVPNNGTLAAANWSGAGVLQVPGGSLLVKNDASHLYVGLDFTAATTNDPGTGDYFWFTVDVDQNGAVTPNRDLLFGLYPGNPNRLVKAVFLAPDETTGIPSNQVLLSQTQEGFGASLNSSVNHRMWTVTFALSELGVSIDPAGPVPTVKFGLRLASPTLSENTPADPQANFSQFNEIVLAVTQDPSYPAGKAGIVIGGVGLIPATLIGADGYATVAPPYVPSPNGAAFAGTLNLIYNTVTVSSLYAAGAVKYIVQHRTANSAAALSAAPWSPILQSWANYLWNGSAYVLQSFGPDSSGRYPLPDPTLDFSTKALLLQWDTSTAPNQLHQFEVQFFNAANAPVSSPAQTLTIALDNQAPDVALVNILHAGAVIPPCAIVNLAGPTDGVQLVFTAFDPEGDLYSWSLDAEYGANVESLIASDSYVPGHVSPAHNWQGVTNLTSSLWKPPYTCAYLFRVSATKRVTDGYEYPIGYYSDFKTVTLIMPGLSMSAKPAPAVEIAMPAGLPAAPVRK